VPPSFETREDALLRMRPVDDVDMIRTSETVYKSTRDGLAADGLAGGRLWEYVAKP